MFRPILLLLPCIVLAMTMAIDSEDELEMHLDAMDIEDEMNLDKDLDLGNEFEEDEEEEDRDLLLDDRLGRPTGPIVGCGRHSNRVVNITNMMTNETTGSIFVAGKKTDRCTVVYQPVDCNEIQLTCTKFLVDNRDDVHCKKGDIFVTKPAERVNSTTREQPRIWCKRDGPNMNFPVLSPHGALKIWYRRGDHNLGAGRYPAKGVRCFATCSKPEPVCCDSMCSSDMNGDYGPGCQACNYDYFDDKYVDTC